MATNKHPRHQSLPIDYSRSFLRWTTKATTQELRTPGHMPYGNSVRILLDARAHITDEETGIDEEFYLIAPCRTEWMYRSDSCIQQPGGEYRLAWSQRKDRALRFSTNRLNPKPRPELEPLGDRYTDLQFTLTPLQNPQHAKDNVALVAAAKTSHQIVVQTQIINEAKSRRATLEYPVKTFNYLVERDLFQIDTGPMLWVDLAASSTDPIHWLQLAHTVYNRVDRAEFVLRGPNPVRVNGQEVAQVEDYQQVIAQTAQHTVFVES